MCLIKCTIVGEKNFNTLLRVHVVTSVETSQFTDSSIINEVVWFYT
jgi:hypothetical protein